MSRAESEIGRQAIYEAVEEQIKAGDPPETAQTLERLKSEGYSHDEALELIAAALAAEVFAVMKEGRTYDDGSYVASLLALPKLPWD